MDSKYNEEDKKEALENQIKSMMLKKKSDCPIKRFERVKLLNSSASVKDKLIQDLIPEHKNKIIEDRKELKPNQSYTDIL